MELLIYFIVAMQVCGYGRLGAHQRFSAGHVGVPQELVLHPPVRPAAPALHGARGAAHGGLPQAGTRHGAQVPSARGEYPTRYN